MKPHDNVPVVAATEPTASESLTRWLVRGAAHRCPGALADRLQEEWLADLAAQRGALTRLRFAIGCCWAIRVIAHDYLTSAAAPAAGETTVIFGPHDLSFFSRRTTILLLIVGLHALVIYGFASGFAQKVVQALPAPMVTAMLNQPETHRLPPPLIVSRLPMPRLTFAPLSPTFDAPSVQLTDTVSAPLLAPPSEQPTVHTRRVTRVLGGPGQGFPDTDDYYPLVSRRLGEAGLVIVRVCVNERGRLASAATIAQSSGSGRLDDAALRLANAGSGHYRTTTQDGVPVAYCYPFRIRFQLRD